MKKKNVEVANIYDENKSAICEIVKKKQDIPASFAVASKIAKLTAAVCD